MHKSRQQLAAQYVLDFFAGTGQTSVPHNMTADEVYAVVSESLRQHGCFPPDAVAIEGDPPIYCGEQIRRLNEGTYVVANVEFFARSTPDGSTTRTFNNERDAVSRFIKGCLRYCT